MSDLKPTFYVLQEDMSGRVVEIAKYPDPAVADAQREKIFGQLRPKNAYDPDDSPEQVERASCVVERLEEHPVEWLQLAIVANDNARPSLKDVRPPLDAA